MDLKELDQYLATRPHVLWLKDDEGNFYFKHEEYDKGEEKVKVTPTALAKLTPAELDKVLVAGRNVEQMTRITGYFSKVSQWNKGKLGELKDRQRVQLN
jgi:Anaerobic ribonucleoside-triphosphate reductase